MMDSYRLELPADIIAATGLADGQLKSALAIQLFRQGHLNREQACGLCGCTPAGFDEMMTQAQPTGESARFDLDEFLSWASHDLKTPLNGVIGFSKIILKGIDGPVSDLQSTDLTSIHTSGQRMLMLISNLVEIARLNRGETKLRPARVEVLPLIEEIAANWQSQNPTRKLMTNFSITTPGLTFDLDEIHLRQVLSNLLTFTAIHVDEAGQLTLTSGEDARGLHLILPVAAKSPMLI
jgi:signal transduction histidine kinase